MRSPGNVYKKLREAKFKHLVVLYRQYTRKTPENCRYHCRYIFTGNDGKTYELPLCLVHQESTDIKDGIFPQLVDVCNGKSQDCNAWAPRYSKEDIQQIFERELKDPSIKPRKYGDICALEWVLEMSVLGVTIPNWVTRIVIKIKKLLKARIA